MADIISDFLNQYGNQLVSAGLGYLANSNAAAAGNANLQQLSTINEDAAKALNEGFSQQLAAREALKPVVSDKLSDFEDRNVAAVNKFGDENYALASKYGTNMIDTSNNTFAQYATGAGDYAGTMRAALESSSPLLTGGYESLTETLSPYVQGGQQAQQFFLNQMGIDPSQMTPTQKLMVEKYLRDANANVNASGLRGAGRAGIAAVNDGLAKLYANIYDQNMGRGTSAATALNSTGYGAAGATGTAQKEMGQQLSQLNYGTGEKQAENLRNLGNKAGELAYTTGKDIAGTALNLGQKTTDTAFGNAKNLAGERLNTEVSLETGLAQNRADTAANIATTNAKALAASGLSDSTKDAIQDYSTGKTFGQIGKVIAGAKPSVTI